MLLTGRRTSFAASLSGRRKANLPSVLPTARSPFTLSTGVGAMEHVYSDCLSLPILPQLPKLPVCPSCPLYRSPKALATSSLRSHSSYEMFSAAARMGYRISMVPSRRSSTSPSPRHYSIGLKAKCHLDVRAGHSRPADLQL